MQPDGGHQASRAARAGNPTGWQAARKPACASEAMTGFDRTSQMVVSAQGGAVVEPGSVAG